MPFQPADTNIVGSVSIGNTTTESLGPNEVYTGEWEDIKDVAFQSITVFADQDSTLVGLSFQWSTDGINLDLSESSSVKANVGRGFALTPRSRYFRLIYTNGSIAQGIFRLAAVFHSSGTGLITRPLAKNLTDDNFAQTVRAVLCAQKADGTYVNVRANDNGVLKVKVVND